MTLLLLMSLAGAWGQDASAEADEDDEFGFLEEGDRNAERLAAEAAEQSDDFDVYEDEDDFQMAFEVARERPESYRMPFSMEGKAALADNYPVTVVVGKMGSLVVELPVLVYAGGPPASEPWWLIGEVYDGDTKVGEARYWVAPASTVRRGPTVAFLKVHAPVKGEQGELEVRVSQVPVSGGEATPLFSRSVLWTLQ